MDENQTELLRLVYTRIGMIMEDASIIALSLGGPKLTFDPAEVARLRCAVQTLSTLITAADALQK